jgi:tetratricopeptide (TPR) repeat protein
MNKLKIRKLPFWEITCVFSLFMQTAIVYSFSLRNYSKNELLAKAMEYDSEMNGGNHEKADRALAEKYYLEYLKDVNESFQKARVYNQLGAMFATAINKQKGEKPDYEKARFYFQKVLEFEPNRIDWPTLRARTMLSSLNETDVGKLKADMDIYQLVLNLNEQKLKVLWLPIDPNNIVPSSLQLTSNVNFLESEKGATEGNIMSIIRDMRGQDNDVYLKEILQRFPNTNLEKLALDYIEKQKNFIKEQPLLISSTAASEPNSKKLLSEPNLTKETLMLEPDKSIFSRPVFYLGIGGVCLIAIGLISIQKNRKSKQSS